MQSTIEQIEYYFPNYSENLNEMKKDNPNWDIEAIVKKTGIKKRFISKESILDMSVKAANKLSLKNNYKKENLDFLVLVTQSPDFPLPTTACVIQDKLGLKKECLSFDVNQGCSGYIYGLAICSSLIQSELAKDLNKKLESLHEHLFLESNPIPVKWALHKMGKCHKGIRLPMLLLSEEYQSIISTDLEKLGLI